jgi:hypothetical protein
MSKNQNIFKSQIGIWVLKFNGQWMVTLDELPEGHEDFHSVEKKVMRNVPKQDQAKIEFDSEYSQFVAYTPSKESAIKLATHMEKLLK